MAWSTDYVLVDERALCMIKTKRSLLCTPNLNLKIFFFSEPNRVSQTSKIHSTSFCPVASNQPTVRLLAASNGRKKMNNREKWEEAKEEDEDNLVQNFY